MSMETTERMLDAGEYVLGTLAGAERAQFEKRLATDAAARLDVRYWENQLAALAQATTPAVPRAIVWTQIAFAAGLHRAGGGSPPARVWQVLTSLATAASVVMAMALWQETQKPPQILVQVQEKIVERPAPASYVGVLQVTGSEARWLVSMTPDRKAMNLHAVGEYKAAAGKYLHLWWLNPAGPVSLGVLPNAGDAAASLPENLDLEKGSGLAISLENLDAVPTAGPKGPVLVAAPVMKSI